jgi:hypothetical protein
MNDIGSAIKECKYYLFADDTLLSVSGTSVQENGEESGLPWKIPEYSGLS